MPSARIYDSPMTLHTSEGVLRYSLTNGLYRLALEVDPGLAEAYRALVPRYIRLNRPRYAPHVSVVREDRVGAAWGRYEGQRVTFQYSPTIWEGSVYYWLRVVCPRLADIRVELGLPATDWYTRPPDDSDFYHLTIGNTK